MAHAQERERDQQRITALESQIRELSDGALEAERRRAFAEQIASLRAEIQDRRGAVAASQPTAAGAEGELDALIAGAVPATTSSAPAADRPAGMLGNAQAAIQSFNPDISLNGDFIGQYRDHQGNSPVRKFDFRELEIGFSGAVDPYTRADAIVTVGSVGNESEVDLEEGYLTFFQLPANLQARVGKFRTEFGKTNPVHLHALPWTDYPLVIQRYFGEEGLSGTGGELSWLVPNAWNQYIAIVYEIQDNDNDKLFAGEESNDVMHVGHLKTFWELSPTDTLEVGASLATGPNNFRHTLHRSNAEGVDVTYRWKPKDAGLYRSFLWQTEIIAAQAEIRGGTESSWGMYSAGEYQFARRWKIGVRFDRTQLPFDSSLTERGYSGYLTFLQSEFVFWRLAYEFIDRNFRDDNVRDDQRLLLQLNFTLGTHPAHKY